MPQPELLCANTDVLDAWPAFGALTETRQASLIQRASARIIKHCRRPGFLEATYDELYDGRNQPTIWLRQRPVLAVAWVEVNGTALDNTNADAWTVNPAKGLLMRGNGQDDLRFMTWFPTGQGNIHIVYSAGYMVVPDEVIEATCWLAKWFNDRGRVSTVFKSEQIGDYKYELNNEDVGDLALPRHVASLLVDYVQDDGPM